MRYFIYDVFTSTPFEGNQLAVYPEPPRDIAVARMQRIAQEMNFSETTFVLPAEAGGDVRMRIFTPGAELPLAGHPTIGTTFALADTGMIARGREQFVFELGVGPIPVSLQWGEQGLSFAWMTQLLPSFGARIDDRAGFAAAIGVEPGELVDLPIQAVSCGVEFLFVPVASRAAVDRVSIDRRALSRVYEHAGCADLAVFVFTADRAGAADDETVYSRMLAPMFGIAEDPATGGASGPLGCYLLTHGMVTPEQALSMVSLQGVAMRRPSRIHISIESRDGAISRVRVGGKAVKVAEGTLLV
jgi:trans-2,3-dihydro-3-hydroxyanthranilate isomerase